MNKMRRELRKFILEVIITIIGLILALSILSSWTKKTARDAPNIITGNQQTSTSVTVSETTVTTEELVY